MTGWPLHAVNGLLLLGGVTLLISPPERLRLSFAMLWAIPVLVGLFAVAAHRVLGEPERLLAQAEALRAQRVGEPDDALLLDLDMRLAQLGHAPAIQRLLFRVEDRSPGFARAFPALVTQAGDSASFDQAIRSACDPRPPELPGGSWRVRRHAAQEALRTEAERMQDAMALGDLLIPLLADAARAFDPAGAPVLLRIEPIEIADRGGRLFPDPNVVRAIDLLLQDPNAEVWQGALPGAETPAFALQPDGMMALARALGSDALDGDRRAAIAAALGQALRETVVARAFDPDAEARRRAGVAAAKGLSEADLGDRWDATHYFADLRRRVRQERLTAGNLPGAEPHEVFLDELLELLERR